MQFRIHYVLLGAGLATFVRSAAIERKGTEPVSTVAQPIDARAENAARSTPWFKFCRNPDFEGDCRLFEGIVTARCYDLADEWNDVCSSAIAMEVMTCWIWSDKGCMGNSAGPVTGSDRFRNLADFGMDNRSSSFECY